MISKESEQTFKVGAVIYKGNRVVSIGFNKMKSHPKLANSDRYYALHAEMSAILNAKQDLTGCVMFVYREFANQKPAISRPCKNCLPVIIESGIKAVYYSDDNKDGYSILKLN
jgi:dCMP deaminase